MKSNQVQKTEIVSNSNKAERDPKQQSDQTIRSNENLNKQKNRLYAKFRDLTTVTVNGRRPD